MLMDAEILFVDEASCDAWEGKFKTWMRADDKFKLDLVSNLNEDRGRLQIQGVISNKQRPFKYMITREGNNKDTFCTFIKNVLLDFPLEKDNTIVILDLATYHYGYEVMEMMLEEGIGVLYLPPSSSNLNPM